MTLQWQFAPFKSETMRGSALGEWLSYSGSFMTRLRAQGIREPIVTVLSEGYRVPLREEACLLGMANRQIALVREVQISSPEGTWMYAKTIVPLTTLTGKEKRLAHLKNRSLGSLLFRDPYLQRSDFEFCVIGKDTAFSENLHRKMSFRKEDIFARRSFFYASSKPILLLEFFLPDMMTLC